MIVLPISHIKLQVWPTSDLVDCRHIGAAQHTYRFFQRCIKRKTKMKKKILALLFLVVSSNSYALSVTHPHIGVAKVLGIPDGFTASANFGFTPGDIGKAVSLPAKAAMCAPAAAAVVAAGLGPEDPVADVAAAAVEAGCVWLVGKVVSYAVSQKCPKGVSATMVVTEELISIPPASPKFNIRGMSCSK